MTFLKRFLKSKWAVYLGILLVVFLALDEFVFTNGTWRYRMTVRVETPEGVKVGSAVREIFVSQGIALTPESHAIIRAKGEAVVVDLGKRGQVFAVMDVNPQYDVFNNFPIPGEPAGSGGGTHDGIRYYRNLKEGKATPKPQNYPLIVRFRDLKDPKSVEAVLQVRQEEVVLPTRHYTSYVVDDHFEKIFGSGVKLKDITIEMTRDPITHEVDKWLHWLNKINGGYLDGQFTGGGPELSNILYSSHFRR
jgi:hypothetical protein